MLLRFATRGSQLALWQTRWVAEGLQGTQPDLRIEVESIRTTGDRLLEVPLARIGDRGLFTKELDAALLDGSADLAVHSLKDVPTQLSDGLVIAAVTRREDPRDVLIVREGIPPSLAALAPGASLGTSSLRRRAQIALKRPDVRVVDARGNLNTRLAKLDAGEYDGLILAAAGIERLGWGDRIAERLDPIHWLPAAGQGALAVVTRADRMDLRETLVPLHDAAAAACTIAERAFLRGLQGGCQVPIGALATLHGATIRLDGLVAGIRGEPMIRAQAEGADDHPQEVGLKLAALLIDRGAEAILSEVRSSTEHPAAV